MRKIIIAIVTISFLLASCTDTKPPPNSPKTLMGRVVSATAMPSTFAVNDVTQINTEKAVIVIWGLHSITLNQDAWTEENAKGTLYLCIAGHSECWLVKE